MTADKTRPGLSGTTDGPALDRDAAERAASERTRDLVRKLTSLADRYDAAAPDSDERAEDRRRRVALMRAAAESGRRVLGSQAPAVPPRDGLTAGEAAEAVRPGITPPDRRSAGQA